MAALSKILPKKLQKTPTLLSYNQRVPRTNPRERHRGTVTDRLRVRAGTVVAYYRDAGRLQRPHFATHPAVRRPRQPRHLPEAAEEHRVRLDALRPRLALGVAGAFFCLAPTAQVVPENMLRVTVMVLLGSNQPRSPSYLLLPSFESVLRYPESSGLACATLL